jgi:hypothetical protein
MTLCNTIDIGIVPTAKQRSYKATKHCPCKTASTDPLPFSQFSHAQASFASAGGLSLGFFVLFAFGSAARAFLKFARMVGSMAFYSSEKGRVRDDNRAVPWAVSDAPGQPCQYRRRTGSPERGREACRMAKWCPTQRSGGGFQSTASCERASTD